MLTIFHPSDAAIRGHVFCSFLALAMQKHLEDLLRESAITPEWKTLLRDLDRLQQVRIYHRDRDWLARTDVAKPIAELFRHAPVFHGMMPIPIAVPRTPSGLGQRRRAARASERCSTK